jgi:hypothetical protein
VTVAHSQPPLVDVAYACSRPGFGQPRQTSPTCAHLTVVARSSRWCRLTVPRSANTRSCCHPGVLRAVAVCTGVLLLPVRAAVLHRTGAGPLPSCLRVRRLSTTPERTHLHVAARGWCGRWRGAPLAEPQLYWLPDQLVQKGPAVWHRSRQQHTHHSTAQHSMLVQDVAFRFRTQNAQYAPCQRTLMHAGQGVASRGDGKYAGGPLNDRTAVLSGSVCALLFNVYRP